MALSDFVARQGFKIGARTIADVAQSAKPFYVLHHKEVANALVRLFKGSVWPSANVREKLSAMESVFGGVNSSLKLPGQTFSFLSEKEATLMDGRAYLGQNLIKLNSQLAPGDPYHWAEVSAHEITHGADQAWHVTRKLADDLGIGRLATPGEQQELAAKIEKVMFVKTTPEFLSSALSLRNGVKLPGISAERAEALIASQQDLGFFTLKHALVRREQNAVDATLKYIGGGEQKTSALLAKMGTFHAPDTAKEIPGALVTAARDQGIRVDLTGANNAQFVSQIPEVRALIDSVMAPRKKAFDAMAETRLGSQLEAILLERQRALPAELKQVEPDRWYGNLFHEKEAFEAGHAVATSVMHGLRGQTGGEEAKRHQIWCSAAL